ncbi:MAG: glycosyltransferase [Fibrobacterota bacterium]
MRIGLVSTHPPIECGIGTYTQFFREGLDKLNNETFVISQIGGAGNGVFPVYWPDDADMAKKIFGISTKMTPDIMHIQHEFNLYGTGSSINIAELLKRYKLLGLPVVITLHTVFPKLSHEEKTAAEMIMNDSTAVIVHEEKQKKTLVSYFGKEEKIHIIPHGIRKVAPVKDARKKTGLEGKKIILQCGYFRETKNFHKMVEIMPQIVEKVPEAVLLIAGKFRLLHSGEYLDKLFGLIRNSPVKENIKVLKGQFPQHTFDTIISACDLMVQPYSVGAQSGIMAQAFAFNKPVVTSDLPAFREAVEQSGGGLWSADDNEYVENIVKILTDEKFMADMKSKIAAHVDKLCWEKIAEKHLEVYEPLVYYPYEGAEHFYAG